MQASAPERTVVIGVGNRWRSDDAAGLLAARRVRDLAPEAVEVTELEGEPVSLLDAFEGADAVLVIDAVSSGAAAGTVHRVDARAEPLPEPLAGPSTHLLGLAEAIELARALGRLPRLLVVYGIEGGRFEAGEGVSGPVAAAVEEAAAAVVDELRGRTPELRASPGPSR
jgi:hydrogenase maturation protease